MFPRNPIKGVVVAAGYYPVLEIHAQFHEIQQRLRTAFPRYEQLEMRNVTVNAADDSVSVSKQPSHRLVSSDGRFTLTITAEQIGLQCTGHVERSEMFEKVEIALKATMDVVGELECTRLGMRYVNHIDLDEVSRDAKLPVGVTDVLVGDFVSLPAAVTDRDSWWMTEVSSSVEGSRGRLTVRCGVLEPLGSRIVLLDIDRFVMQPGNIGRPDLVELSNDVFAVFLAAASPTLLDWMRAEKER